MDNNFPFNVGDIQEFHYHGDRLKNKIEDIQSHDGHLVVITSFESVPKDFVFPADQSEPIVEEKKMTCIEKIKEWFN